MTGNRNLVVVRAGDASLHPSWLAADGDKRAWDLHISYFGKREQPYGVLPEGVTLSHQTGSKYHGLKADVERHIEWLDRYQRIAFPDDDLQAAVGSWNDVFAIMEETDALLGQPSLVPLSFFSHPVTVQRPAYRYRETNFVEVMAPVFRTDLLREALPLFTDNETSWGLDFLFIDLVNKRGGKMVITDSTAFLHTRRVGKGSQYKPGAISPRQDKYQTLARHGLAEFKGKALRGVRADGRSDGAFRANRGTLGARFNRLLVNLLDVNVIMR